MRLENKIALITGGSRGIGRGIAIGFALEGANVIVTLRASKDHAIIQRWTGVALECNLLTDARFF